MSIRQPVLTRPAWHIHIPSVIVGLILALAFTLLLVGWAGFDLSSTANANNRAYVANEFIYTWSQDGKTVYRWQIFDGRDPIYKGSTTAE